VLALASDCFSVLLFFCGRRQNDLGFSKRDGSRQDARRVKFFWSFVINRQRTHTERNRVKDRYMRGNGAEQRRVSLYLSLSFSESGNVLFKHLWWWKHTQPGASSPLSFLTNVLPHPGNCSKQNRYGAGEIWPGDCSNRRSVFMAKWLMFAHLLKCGSDGEAIFLSIMYDNVTTFGEICWL